jgi:outer membrane receptor protein involved in Fe transport
MMKLQFKTNMLICFTLLGISLSAQISISGEISNRVTGETLTGANIIVKELNFGSTSNESGSYHIDKLKPGKYTLEVSFIGFNEASLNIHLKEGEHRTFNFQLDPANIEMSSVVITGTRTQRKMEDIPARMALMDAQQVKEYPASNVDDLLKSVSNIYVNRSWGIFSKNTSVTMRGLDGTQRTLVLLDGVPLNKVSGGQIQWSLIQPEDVERIEVLKGPGSALYGMNAMGGVINVITKKPQKKFNLDAGLQLGSMNTIGGNLSLGGNYVKDNKGLYWDVNGFYRQGDGYILEPEELRDSTDTEAYLFEGNLSGMLGYRFNANHLLELRYEYHDEKRGDGRQVFEEDGGYNRYAVHYARANYQGNINGAVLVANAFYQLENYIRQSETVNATGEYRLYETDSKKQDQGLWLTLSKEWVRNNNFTLGADIHDGSVDATDTYYTSTDEIQYKGKLSFVGLFVQDEISMMNNKLKLIAGLRLEVANFRDGSLQVTNPSSVTAFPGDINEGFAGNTWTSVSPKFSGMFTFNPKISAYLSLSSGFNPPKLDDLCKSGKINKGFKIANPELQPETIGTVEIGANWKPHKKISIEPSLYFSVGKDFQYFVPTGDSIDTGGGDLKPYLRRENISEVEIIGGELNFEYLIINGLSLNANYAYNHSVIKKYDDENIAPDDDLTGKFLAEVPMNTAFVGINWRNNIMDVYLTCNYMGEMWADELNTEKIDDYFMFDINLSKTFLKHYRVSLMVQDVFDKQPIDKKMMLSPGRFFLAKLQYQL